MSNADEFERQLHERLLARDPLASEEVAQLFLEPIRKHVRLRAYAHGIVDLDLINDATVDAVFDYIRHPEKFSPAKASLRTCLKFSAERDLINAVRKDRRRRKGEELSADVELTLMGGNKECDIRRIRQDIDDALINAVTDKEPIDEVVEVVQAGRDQDLVRMIMDGERRTSAFADALGISDLPIPEQRRIVKQHKDRLKQQLKRAGGKRCE